MTSTLTHTVQCPNCGRPVAASLAHVGQRVACPSCRGEFLLSPTALLAPSSGGSKSGSSVVAPPVQRPVAPPTPPAPRGAPNADSYTVEPPLPPANVQTAQFLASKPQAPAIAPQADGKLPTLQLADAPDAAAKSGSEASPVPLWAALLAVAASTAVSMILLLGVDFGGTQSAQSQQVQARQDLARFYATGVALPKPYQLELREGQLAHSRGDRRAEREHYRKVLAQLRAEGRSKFQGLTGTPAGDAELDRILSILLSEP
jgi:DNA-directed RNA polymerase subunit RPC12/RpoP